MQQIGYYPQPYLQYPQYHYGHQQYGYPQQFGGQGAQQAGQGHNGDQLGSHGATLMDSNVPNVDGVQLAPNKYAMPGDDVPGGVCKV